MLLTLVAFVTAIGLLVAVHEWGHYRMARACGVRVIRFSIGFGPRIWSWRMKGVDTEFSISAIPLGGYVKMLDQREAPVPQEELSFAFDTQSLRKRAAIVAAGPAANLVLALLLYTAVNWMGVSEPAAVLAHPPAGSLMARASLVGGERVLRVSQDGVDWIALVSFEDLRWQLAQAALKSENLQLEVARGGQAGAGLVELPLSTLDTRQADATLFQAIGLTAPYSAALLGDLTADGAARAAGLISGDLVLEVNGQPVADSGFLRDLIRASGRSGQPATQDWLVERAGKTLHIAVTPRRDLDAGQPIGRVGAVIGTRPEMVLVRSGPLEGVIRAAEKTWEVSTLTLRMMGRIVTGDASPKNISGPITIADYAGRSAAMGLTQFLAFLALISVSLGVLNLLPLPVLDGGHLLYYLWEGVTGRSPSEAWLAALQKLGVGVLLLMMSVAIFNDVSRLLG